MTSTTCGRAGRWTVAIGLICALGGSWLGCQEPDIEASAQDTIESDISAELLFPAAGIASETYGVTTWRVTDRSADNSEVVTVVIEGLTGAAAAIEGRFEFGARSAGSLRPSEPAATTVSLLTKSVWRTGTWQRLSDNDSDAGVEPLALSEQIALFGNLVADYAPGADDPRYLAQFLGEVAPRLAAVAETIDPDQCAAGDLRAAAVDRACLPVDAFGDPGELSAALFTLRCRAYPDLVELGAHGLDHTETLCVADPAALAFEPRVLFIERRAFGPHLIHISFLGEKNRHNIAKHLGACYVEADRDQLMELGTEPTEEQVAAAITRRCEANESEVYAPEIAEALWDLVERTQPEDSAAAATKSLGGFDDSSIASQDDCRDEFVDPYAALAGGGFIDALRNVRAYSCCMRVTSWIDNIPFLIDQNEQCTCAERHPGGNTMRVDTNGGQPVDAHQAACLCPASDWNPDVGEAGRCCFEEDDCPAYYCQDFWIEELSCGGGPFCVTQGDTLESSTVTYNLGRWSERPQLVERGYRYRRSGNHSPGSRCWVDPERSTGNTLYTSSRDGTRQFRAIESARVSMGGRPCCYCIGSWRTYATPIGAPYACDRGVGNSL
ncbi:MAG: hypothetical protein AAGC55_02810 [Myxococcota bacterium]